jgi:hypothetical protein
LKLNGTHQLLVYVDDDHVLGGSVPTYYKEKPQEVLVVASKETGLEADANKTWSYLEITVQGKVQCNV